jgi:DNA repair ATPase RecN
MENLHQRNLFDREGFNLQNAFALNRFEKIYTVENVEKLKRQLDNFKGINKEKERLEKQLQCQILSLTKVDVFKNMLDSLARRYEKAESMFTVAEEFADIATSLVDILPEAEHVFENNDSIDSIMYDITNKAPHMQLTPDKKRKKSFESRHVGNTLRMNKIQKRIS